MANKTISIGFKVEDGGKGLKTLTLDAGELRKVMGATVTEAERMNKSFARFSADAIGLDSISNSLQAINSVFSELTAAYNTQVEAETKLETVMMQRMSATASEIQSIKDLCSAQQQLGVIGDEVQLAGAQQVATFLNSKAALETLIPAVNNLVAQQKGLNATQGDAVTIANLLGKAMQGQTSALRRVGITFSEAEEAAVKNGDEMQRAAALAQIITNNVGEMNAALAATPAGQMKQMSNNIGDLKERVGGLLKDIAPCVTQANQLMMAFMNLQKMNGAVRQIAGFVRNIGREAASASGQVKLLGVSFSSTNVAAKAVVITVRTLSAALNGLLISTGVGIALMAVGSAVGLLMEKLSGVKDAADDAKDSINSLADTQNAETEALKNTQAQLASHIAQLETFKGSKAKEKALVEELNNTYGETMGYFESVADWYKALKKNSEAYTKQVVLEAQARMLANKIAAVEDAQFNATHNPDGSKKPEVPRAPLKAAENGNWNIPQGNALMDGYDKFLTTKKDNLYKELTGIFDKIAGIQMPLKGSSVRSGDKGGKSTGKDKENTPENTIKWYEDKISEIETKIKLTTDPDAIMTLQQEIEQHKEKISELKIWVNIVNGSERMKELEAELNAKPLTIKIKVDKGEISKELKDIPAQFRKSRIQASSLSKDVENVAEVGRAAASAFGSMGDAMEAPALNVAAIIAGAIANIMAGFASASAKEGAQGSSPWDWIAFAVSGLATAVAAVAQVKQVTAFANGGIVSGPTMALVGEYAGASNNPEVIAPLDKLRSILGSPEGVGVTRVEVYGRLRGSDIELCQRNYNRVRSASGHGG